MRVFTREDLKTFRLNEVGGLICLSGDYSNILEFPECTDFDINCVFGEGTTFGQHCTFRSGCRFGKNITFAAYCLLAPGCIFDKETTVFGEKCIYYDSY